MSAVATETGPGSLPTSGSRFMKIWGSTVGLKLIMAATGVLLSAFVLGHMVGNLQVFQGAEALDAYGALLHKEPAILWGARLSLLGAVGLHIWAYLVLTGKNAKARDGPSASRSVGSRPSPHARCGRQDRCFWRSSFSISCT